MKKESKWKSSKEKEESRNIDKNNSEFKLKEKKSLNCIDLRERKNSKKPDSNNKQLELKWKKELN